MIWENYIIFENITILTKNIVFNSPGLVPLACQILDTFLFLLVLLPSSSLLPFFLSSFFPLLSSLFVLTRLFWEESARIYRWPPGGAGEANSRFNDRRTTCQLRVTIALFFDAVFLPFLYNSGSHDGFEILPNPSKIDFKIALDFQFVFDGISIPPPLKKSS